MYNDNINAIPLQCVRPRNVCALCDTDVLQATARGKCPRAAIYVRAREKRAPDEH